MIHADEGKLSPDHDRAKHLPEFAALTLAGGAILRLTAGTDPGPIAAVRQLEVAPCRPSR